MSAPTRFIYIVSTSDEYGTSSVAACLSREEAEGMASHIECAISDDTTVVKVPVISWPIDDTE